MKAHLKNIIGAATLGLALLVNAVPTWAGFVYSHEVVVTSTYATGAVQAARFSSDSQQYIACMVRSFTSPLQLSCEARDKNGAFFKCETYDVGLIELASTMTSHSFIAFSAPSGSSTCDGLHVNNVSYLLK